MFLVNKVIYNEARAVLYGQNTYNINININTNAFSKGLDGSNVFGLFDDPARKHLLRDLRAITLHINMDDGSPLAMEHHRQRLQRFVRELQMYSHDSEQKFLLRKLKVDWHATPPRRPAKGVMAYIFGLEGLTALSGINEVEFTGTYVPPWLIECLTRCLKGSAEPPSPIDYLETVVRKRQRDKGDGVERRHKNVVVSTKKWCDPCLNWAEFANREGIKIPEDDRLMFPGLKC
ncbi:hypothetical protein P171DRAFT_485051 [Karstenula rhodostoma CBS 690.94]|uniref:Uncharacterized protein n=1 Tax=Karstenula rhodostoma CBS 690.94 TaxID=1392251 RepID=A0A9P4PJ27_9PLEO|nr:hypothetical protein P171DRAFT_485051 [Karstenula rhodostoma CBS 690.94]